LIFKIKKFDLKKNKNLIYKIIMENETKTNIDGMRKNFTQIKMIIKGLEIEKYNLRDENLILKKEVMLYKSLFTTHRNSVVLNLHIKKINGEKFWVDPINDPIGYLQTLDLDDEVKQWLEPVKCER
jgi:hypothetical protein